MSFLHRWSTLDILSLSQLETTCNCWLRIQYVHSSLNICQLQILANDLSAECAARMWGEHEAALSKLEESVEGMKKIIMSEDAGVLFRQKKLSEEQSAVFILLLRKEVQLREALVTRLKTIFESEIKTFESVETAREVMVRVQTLWRKKIFGNKAVEDEKLALAPIEDWHRLSIMLGFHEDIGQLIKDEVDVSIV